MEIRRNELMTLDQEGAGRANPAAKRYGMSLCIFDPSR